MHWLTIILKNNANKLIQHLSVFIFFLFWRKALISFAFIITLSHPIAHALVLNDTAANDFGGIENYWDQKNEFPSVVSLYNETLMGGVSICSGTLISPRIVMTAAHCVAPSAAFKTKDFKIRFSQDANIKSYNDRSIENIYMHPSYDINTYYSNYDIAFLSLDHPVVDVKPSKAFFHIQALSMGHSLYFVGYGAALAASSKEYVKDFKRRVGYTSMLGDVYNNDHYEYVTVFRDPKLSGVYYNGIFYELDNIAPYLEAMPYFGDSGGPLFIKGDNGEYYQIAIVKGGSTSPGMYGSYENWTPLSEFNEWYFQTSPVKDVASLEGASTWSNHGSWNNGHLGLVIPDNIYPKSEPYSFAANYYNVYISPGSSLELDKDITVDALEIKGPNASLLIREKLTLTTLAGTSLYNGRLTVNGELAATSLALSQSIVDGTGSLSVNGDIVNKDSTVIPGYHHSSGVVTPGVLTFYGDYKQMDDATLTSYRVNGLAGRLEIGGTASLGGTLHILGDSNNFNNAQQYQVVFATEGVHGHFDKVINNHYFLDADVIYGPNNVSYRLVRNMTPFVTFADNPNAAAVARALETVATENKAYQTIENSNEDEAGLSKIGQSFRMLSGEVHASAISTVYSVADNVRDSLLNRVRGRQKTSSASDMTTERKLPQGFQSARNTAKDDRYFDPQYFMFWGTGVGSWAQSHSDWQSAGLETSTGGFLVGAEASLDQTWRIGAASGFLQSAFHMNNRNSTGQNDAVFGALYGLGSYSDVQIRGGVSYTHNALTTKRSVKLASYTDALAASRNMDAIQSFGELGYQVAAGRDVRIEPFISGSFLRVRAGSFYERGGDAALYGSGRTYDLGSTMVALKGEVLTGEASSLMVRSTIGWRHAFGDIRPQAQLAFSQGSETFSVSGSPVDRHTFVAEAEAEWQLAHGASMSIAAGAQMGRKNMAHTLKGNVVWRF